MKPLVKQTLFLLIVTSLQSCTTTDPTSEPIKTLPATSTLSRMPSSTPSPTASTAVTQTPTLTSTPICPSLSTLPATIEMELFGNFHSMGVIVTINDIDPDMDAMAALAYRTGSEPFQAGFPLSRVSASQFIGSLFWLEPGTTYDVQVTFMDEGAALHCAAITASASTRAEIEAHEPVTTYVVSPDGSGSSCTMDAPCTLITGINHAMPGDMILLRGGVYYQGDISLPRSGTAEAPIVIQGAEGEQAILDGGDPETFVWTPLEDGVYETTSNVSGPSLVMADGQRLYRYQSYEDLQNLTWDLPGFFAQGYRVYVHLERDADPNEHEMIIGRRMYGFWVEQDYIQIQNLTFRHYEVRWYRSGLYIRNGSYNLIQGCTFAINGYGIILQGAAHRNVIEDNEFYDTIYEWSWDAVKALHDQTGQGMETGGIRIYDPHRDGPYVMPRGTVIRRNSFHDFFDGFGVCSFETAGIPTNETDVYENHIYRVGDDGMEADGYCSNVRIWGNTFERALVGISLAPARIGPTYVMRNLVYEIGRSDGCPFGRTGPCGGTALKFQFNEPGTGPMFLFHNTMDGGSRDYTVFISEEAAWPLLVSRNNIWGSPRSGGLGNEVDDPVDFDYDNIFVHPGNVLVFWRGQDYISLEAFTLATGQEAHGLSVDPQFIDLFTADYGLQPHSPLIDAGEFIPGINHDYFGSGPDIGTFEYRE